MADQGQERILSSVRSLRTGGHTSVLASVSVCFPAASGSSGKAPGYRVLGWFRAE